MPTTPHPITNEQIPLVLGHEFSAIVEEIGEPASSSQWGSKDRVKVGDRVVVRPIIYDGVCDGCTQGWLNCCDKGGFVGLSG